MVIDQNKIPRSSLTEIKKTEVVKTPAANADPEVSRSVTYSIAQIIQFVNSGDVLRYLSDKMLSEEQKVTKWEAVAETAKYTADKNNALYVAIALESINKDGVVVQEVANIDAVCNVRSNMQSTAESTVESAENAESQEEETKASKREDADADINDYVDKYTSKEYNSYGWARANDVLSAKENERLRSLFAQAVTGNYFPKTKSGEYMIAIGENVDNKIAYMTGEIDNPVITRILEIDEYNETKLDELRRETYALERRGIQRKAGGIFHTYTAASFGSSGYQSRSGVQSQRYNNQLGTERGAGSKTTSRVKEILFDDDGNEISREYIRHSKRENDETYSTEELANAFESIAKTKHEKSLVRQYKDNIGKRKELIDQRFALIKERSDWRGQKGSEAAAKRSELNAKIKNLSERISRYDLQLLLDINVQEKRKSKSF